MTSKLETFTALTVLIKVTFHFKLETTAVL